MTSNSENIVGSEEEKVSPHCEVIVAMVPPSLSAAQAAFVALADKLGRAIAAEVRRLELSSGDSESTLNDAEVTFEEMMKAARNAGGAMMINRLDRQLVDAARLIFCAMSLEDNEDRDCLLEYMTEVPSNKFDCRGGIARWVDELVDTAIERLVRLNDLLYHPHADLDLRFAVDGRNSLRPAGKAGGELLGRSESADG